MPSDNKTKENDMKLEKATYNDIHRYLHEAVERINIQEKDEYGNLHRCYCYMQDADDDYVYVYLKGDVYRMSYSMKGNEVTIDTETATKVVAETNYTVTQEDESVERSLDEDSLVLKIVKGIDKYFGGSSRKSPEETIVIKQFEEDEMIAVEPLYICPDEVDGHSDSMSEEEIRKMVDNMNKAIQEKRLKGNLFHHKDTDKFEVIKAWMNEVDCIIGETFVPEGQPIVKTKFHDKKLWELRKTGVLKGVSIGAKAKSYEEVEV